MNGHRAHNKIMSISTANGQRVVGEAEVHLEVVNHFREFLDGPRNDCNNSIQRLSIQGLIVSSRCS